MTFGSDKSFPPGHKIRFDTLNEAEFEAIWQQVCDERGIDFNKEVLDYLIKEHYEKEQKPMLPCHPRDLIGLALDMIHYKEEKVDVTPDTIHSAWQSYFVRL